MNATAKTRARPIRDPNDYGPSAAMSRREVVDAADPDNPNRTVRRARVVCHYDTAWRRGSLTAEERNACDRYARLVEAAGGACEDRGEFVGDRPPPHMRDGGILAKVRAQAVITDANAALGRSATKTMRLYVVANMSADDMAERDGLHSRVVWGLVVAAVRRLTEHWAACAPDRC